MPATIKNSDLSHFGTLPAIGKKQVTKKNQNQAKNVALVQRFMEIENQVLYFLSEERSWCNFKTNFGEFEKRRVHILFVEGKIF